LLGNSFATKSINNFAYVAKQASDVQPEDPILEIPLSEFQHLLKELAATYNQIAETIRDAGILRGRELARITEDNSRALKAEKSPITKFLMLNAFIRQYLAKVREALKSRPQEGGKVVQVCSKIMARAVQIIDYVKTTIQDDPLRRMEISFDSQQVRILFKGAGEPRPVSRRDTIQAMKRAEALWPALNCGHRPNDGRKTTRLTARVEELKDVGPMIMVGLSDRYGKQRSTLSI
jgi:hypothetical protein